MKTADKNEIGVVVECYDHDAMHRVLIVRSQDVANSHFFYTTKIPQVDFRDRIQMNFAEGKLYVRRGNSKLIFKVIPLEFPGTLLWELIAERTNM